MRIRITARKPKEDPALDARFESLSAARQRPIDKMIVQAIKTRGQGFSQSGARTA